MSSQPRVCIAGLQRKEWITLPSPHTQLQYAVDEFCKKHNLDASLYTLTSNIKSIDLSLPWRFQGLSNNAHLEIREKATLPTRSQPSKRKPKICKVALQLEDQRYPAQFPTSTPIWNVFRTIETQHQIVLTTRMAQNGTYLMPSIVHMNRQYKDFDAFQTTLSKMGIKGGETALFRFHFLTTDLDWKQAKLTIEERFSSMPNVEIQQNISEQSTPVVTSNPTSIVSSSKLENQNEIQNQIQNQSEPQPTIPLQIEAKDIKLFKLGTMEAEDLSQIDDSVFDLKPQELSRILSNTEKQKKLNEQLVSAKFREEREKKHRKYDYCLIRIRFPSGYILQGRFEPQHQLKHVETMIRNVLQDSKSIFYLYTSPPVKKYADMESTLETLGFVPAQLLNISSKTSELDIKPELIEKYSATDLTESVPRNLNQPQNTENKKTTSTTTSNSQKKSGGGMPKWFKMGKK